jgi:3-deoxy-D-manno-octulosonic acid (KDO) 8-phosphate synthase
LQSVVKIFRMQTGRGKGAAQQRPGGGGVDAVFLECHPDPDRAFSDKATCQPLAAATKLLEELARIREVVVDAYTS